VVLVILIRVIPKRNAGHISPNDMLTLIVLGGMGTDAILGGSTSVVEILLMIGLIVAWSYAFDLLEYHFPSLARMFRHRQTTPPDQEWPFPAPEYATRTGDGRGIMRRTPQRRD